MPKNLLIQPRCESAMLLRSDWRVIRQGTGATNWGFFHPAFQTSRICIHLLPAQGMETFFLTGSVLDNSGFALLQQRSRLGMSSHVPACASLGPNCSRSHQIDPIHHWKPMYVYRCICSCLDSEDFLRAASRPRRRYGRGSESLEPCATRKPSGEIEVPPQVQLGTVTDSPLPDQDGKQCCCPSSGGISTHQLSLSHQSCISALVGPSQRWTLAQSRRLHPSLP